MLSARQPKPAHRSLLSDLEELADHALDAANALKELMSANPRDCEKLRYISAQKEMSRELAQSLVEKLDRIFIAPLEREDIHAIAIRIDRATRTLWKFAQRLELLFTDCAEAEFISHANYLCEAVEIVRTITRYLSTRKLSSLTESVARLDAIKQLADTQRDQFVQTLHRSGRDPLDVMKRIEAIQLLDNGLSLCDQLANVCQQVLLKNV